MDDNNTEQPKKGKGKFIFIIIICALAIVVAILWYINYNKYISTDDANLDSYRIDIAPQVTGLIKKLYVAEGDTVKEGDALFDIESSSMVSRKQGAIAQYEQLNAQIIVAQSNLVQAQKDYEVAQLQEQLSETNYKRALKQYESDVIPQETFQNIQENWKTAKIQTEIAKNRIASVRADIDATKKSADAQMANVETMETDLSYYRVTAPSDGIIAKRWYLAGDMINAGETMFTLNKGKDLWVAVYLEETKFSNIFKGQDVIFTLDAYKKLKFKGKIFYIGDNAASEFALVPANNASGNFTKVTQRIPLKVSIDSVEGDAKDKENLKLISGMSANVKIVKK